MRPRGEREGVYAKWPSTRCTGMGICNGWPPQLLPQANHEIVSMRMRKRVRSINEGRSRLVEGAAAAGVLPEAAMRIE